MHLLKDLLLRLAQPPEEGAGCLLRQDAIDDDAVDAQSMQEEIHEGALRFPQHHALGIGHQPHTGHTGVLQNPVDAIELREQILDVRKIGI